MRLLGFLFDNRKWQQQDDSKIEKKSNA